MSRAKIAITMDEATLSQVDKLVKKSFFPSRSAAIEAAVREKLDRLDQSRLARECAKLDPSEERAMAEEGLSKDLDTWPGY